MYFLAFSGGLDSSTLLAQLHADARLQSEGITPVFFNYGSKHNPFELAGARAVAAFYGYETVMDVVDMGHSGIFNKNASALMAESAQAVPAAAYAEPGSLAATLVPGRNLMLASVLAAKAEGRFLLDEQNSASRQPNTVALAVHGGDHALYPDCRPDFINALSLTIEKSSEARVMLQAPFLTMSKTEIVKLGLGLGVPYHLTRSCYQAQDKACGECGTCRERLAAFKANGVQDPAEYA